MKKLIILALIFTAACKKETHKGRQIVIQGNKRWYCDYYNVYLETGCITFMSYEGNDSSFVKVCKPWDVKPNPNQP